MIETLYKTETPEKGRSECYVLVLNSRPASQRKVYVFMEEHGHWDPHFDRFIYEVNSISTDTGLTQQEAFAMYNTAKKKLSLGGFIHSFRPDFNRKKPNAYQLFDTESVCA
jgi:hypothetical protein